MEYSFGATHTSRSAKVGLPPLARARTRNEISFIVFVDVKSIRVGQRSALIGTEGLEDPTLESIIWAVRFDLILLIGGIRFRLFRLLYIATAEDRLGMT